MKKFGGDSDKGRKIPEVTQNMTVELNKLGKTEVENRKTLDVSSGTTDNYLSKHKKTGGILAGKVGKSKPRVLNQNVMQKLKEQIVKKDKERLVGKGANDNIPFINSIDNLLRVKAGNELKTDYSINKDYKNRNSSLVSDSDSFQEFNNITPLFHPRPGQVISRSLEHNKRNDNDVSSTGLLRIKSSHKSGQMVPTSDPNISPTRTTSGQSNRYTHAIDQSLGKKSG